MSAPEHNGKLYIETVGCQMNMLDSELVVAELRKQGFSLTTDVKDADTILFNTCSVRDHAEHKIYSQLGRLKFSKRARPNQVIGVMGCMAQKDQELIFNRAPHVDLVVGTGQLKEIPRLIDEARSERGRRMAVSLDRKEGSRAEVASSFESYDPLATRPCGQRRSSVRPDHDRLRQVLHLLRRTDDSRPRTKPSTARDRSRSQTAAQQGVKEVTLLGQTVNSYKVTQDGKLFRLSDLLELIHDTEGILRLKFVTNYPRDMTDDLLQAVRDLPKVAQYLHVPAQSGCDEVLKRMKRGYTVGEYREMYARIREALPTAAVSSDFIVGMCGETDESYQKSLDLIRECRFKNSFIFKYSPRPGTKAIDLWTDDVPEEVKRHRNNEMLDLQNQISEEDNANLIGSTFEVLVEGISKSARKAQAAEGLDNSFVPQSTEAEPTAGPTQLVGRTRCDRIVVFNGNPRSPAVWRKSPSTTAPPPRYWAAS